MIRALYGFILFDGLDESLFYGLANQRVRWIKDKADKVNPGVGREYPPILFDGQFQVGQVGSYFD
jgi:hypothetical protein